MTVDVIPSIYLKENALEIASMDQHELGESETWTDDSTGITYTSKMIDNVTATWKADPSSRVDSRYADASGEITVNFEIKQFSNPFLIDQDDFYSYKYTFLGAQTEQGDVPCGDLSPRRFDAILFSTNGTKFDKFVAERIADYSQDQAASYVEELLSLQSN
ncbi:uncharacterized protein L201_007919 [Kwoniella dendrophila CBS 6074]|uniref:Uncharacterized protein n=1 Tax=Kwoniella dendrophila CBS 6074 TaxID=1295534 RepID=A0AAX4K5G3_9TREE